MTPIHRVNSLILIASSITRSEAFLTPVGHFPLQIRPGYDTSIEQPNQRGDVSLLLFGDLFKKLKQRAGKAGNDDGESGVPSISSSNKTSDTEESGNELNPTDKGHVAMSSVEISPKSDSADDGEEESTLSIAEKLRAQAGRIRLEAEKEQVELTLQKISKLSAKLDHMEKQDKPDAKERKELEDTLLALKCQLATDEPVQAKADKLVDPTLTTPEHSVSGISNVPLRIEGNVDTPAIKQPLSGKELQEITSKFDNAPEFIRILVAKIAGFGVDESTPGAIDRLNSTDIIQQLYKDDSQLADMNPNSQDTRALLERSYQKSKSIEDMDEPELTEAQINAKVQDLKEIPVFLKDLTTGGRNDTQIAIDLLTEEWRREKMKRRIKKFGFGSLFGEEKLKENNGTERTITSSRGSFNRIFPDESVDQTEFSEISLMMKSTFPASSRKEGEAPSERQVNIFITDIIAPTKSFTPSENPIQVAGGWIIRGKNQCESGNELVEKLDNRMANDARLRDKISFFVIQDPLPNPEDIMLDPQNWPQVIFVAGPNVARDPRPILGTIISAVGISTTWYASIYPFLTNTNLFDRASEAMNLADAGMPVDLSWLSDKSIPLFLAFMGLQATHEFAHIAVAKSKNLEITIPTLVPSVISGITGSITSLKAPPKNKSDLIDFSLAGPLTGMICSLIVEVLGLRLTATADLESLQSFPGLPLSFLRQSSLGGGLIDLILGNGVLNVPSSATGSDQLASTIIQLHPLAIAGYVSLLVNALAVVPVGRTDGGRTSMSLVGRSGSQAVTLGSLVTLFVLGLSSSDLILFYFGFVVLGQGELEIPLRNEVDSAEFSRICLAIFSASLMILTLAPIK